MLQFPGRCTTSSRCWAGAVYARSAAQTEVERALGILGGYLDAESAIVRVMAMQGLADLAGEHQELLLTVRPLLEQLTRDGTAAMRARGRKLLAQLGLGPTQRRRR